MWDTIINLLEIHHILNKLSARRQFYNSGMEIGEKVLVLLNRLRQISGKLKYMGVEIDGDEIIMTVFNPISESYGIFMVSLDALGNDDGCLKF